MSREHRMVIEKLEASAQASPQVAWREPPRWLPPTFHSLAYRNYLLLLIGQMSHSLAQWMDMVARSVLVIAITGSAVQLGLVTLVRGVPMMFLGPMAGILADRMDRRLLMLIAKGLSMAVNVIFAAIILTGKLELWHVYVTAITKSLLMAFDQPARQALLPATVPPHLLVNAVALNMGFMQAMRIVSASVAGLFIAGWALAFGFGEHDARAFGGVYLAIVISYIGAVVATYLLRVPAGGRVERSEESWITTFVAGIRFASRNPVILGVLILLGVQSAFGMPYLQVFVPWIAIEVMDIGAEGAGLLIAVSGVGALAGAAVVAAKGHQMRRRGFIIIAGLALYGGALAALGLTSTLPLVTLMGLTLPVLPLAMIIVVGIGQTAITSIKNTLLLESTPNELRGRVMSFQSLDRGFTTVGGGLGGFAIAFVGGPFAQALFGVFCAAGAILVGVFSPGLRKHD